MNDGSKDSGWIGGKEILNYKDGWHCPNEVRQEVNPKLVDDWKQHYESRQRFAVAIANKLDEENISVDAEPKLDASGWIGSAPWGETNS